jgi:TolB-like protein
MSPDHSADVKFEIGHVLFIDIVGYSKLLINEQSEQIQKLKEIVRGTEQFRIAEAGETEVKHGARVHVLNLHTGDLGNPELPEKLRQAKGRVDRATAKPGAVAPPDEAFWVAVLPFKTSGGVEIESFADGLSEDITTGLSRFPYLSVVARAAAAQLKGHAGDERTLGARYVVEGSIRKQGSAIRVSARLIDTENGAQLWAETYDRDLEVSNIFAEQDNVAARIVATVADRYGVLVNSMTAQSQQGQHLCCPMVRRQDSEAIARRQATARL